jgi:hypothetical protein
MGKVAVGVLETTEFAGNEGVFGLVGIFLLAF